jgi:hypothetical protein
MCAKFTHSPAICSCISPIYDLYRKFWPLKFRPTSTTRRDRMSQIMLKSEKNMSPKWTQKIQGVKVSMQLKGLHPSVFQEWRLKARSTKHRLQCRTRCWPWHFIFRHRITSNVRQIWCATSGFIPVGRIKWYNRSAGCAEQMNEV